MKLYNYFASSTSFRVRIALHLKGLSFEYIPVALKWKDGDQDSESYGLFNPQHNVPVLVDGDIKVIQSLAIMEYLEETHPEPRLLPPEPMGRARVRGLSLHIACEMQPLNNLRVERHLATVLQVGDSALRDWRQHWIRVGFDHIERQLADEPATGAFCHGDTPTMADCCLIPQVTNALRPTVSLELGPWPTIRRIYDHCLTLPAFEKALPRNQPDAKPSAGPTAVRRD